MFMDEDLRRSWLDLQNLGDRFGNAFRQLSALLQRPALRYMNVHKRHVDSSSQRSL
jgi:hypothetical protein